MADPLTADVFLRALKAEGVKVVEHTGWRTRNRNHRGAWGPVHGVMNHHTVTPPKVDAVPICLNGSSDLPGPLAIGVVKRNGEVHLIGYGRTNHAGGGDPNVLQAVIDERYTTRPPEPHQHQGSAGAVDGNARFYGFEHENNGDNKDPWPAAQVEAIVRLNAAIIRAHRAKGDGWSEKSSIGHLEWSDWKNDPRGPGWPGMPSLRTRVGERLKHAASWSPTAPKPTTPTNGAPVSAPNLTLLSRPDDTQLLPNNPVTLYWTQEHTDTGNTHGTGGKTVLTNGRYSAVVNVAISGLDLGEAVEVYAVEEDADGRQIGAAYASSVYGVGGEGAAPVQVSVPVVGTVGQRLAIQVKNTQETSVQLTHAWLTLLSWANA